MRTLNLSRQVKILTLAVVLVTGLAGAATATEAGTFAKALAQAEAQNKILVVDFYTDW
jgi:adenylylsulfate kinase-like enzyme